ncbi:helix-turn-helix domain-containing protein [Streptomyces sp. NPDC051064]|uniref:helix-turn-helix domain-containing protein n=1 Tax=Streptomyces sp. NPDC051064 TaxID=3365641 RepID=UPI0037B4257A
MPHTKRPQPSSDEEQVHVVRWPLEASKLEHFRHKGALRLLVIENGATPPVSTDVREDWVRSPITREDFAARVSALRARALSHDVPVLDHDGLLRYCSRVVPVSPTEMYLLRPLVQRFGSLVGRDELLTLLSTRGSTASRNALDLHVMRIRRRVLPLGLRVRTASRRGYLLEALG